MRSKNFKNILIVRTDRIGDVVLTTPAIKAIRRAYPMARISILVSSQTFDLVNGNPYVDEILIDDRQGKHKSVLGFMRLLQSIRSKKFDLAIIFHTKRRYNLLCFLGSIPCRLGYKNNKFGFLLTNPVTDTRAKGQKHEAQYCLDVLQSIGITAHDLDPFVPLQKKAETWVLEWMQANALQSDGMILIHPGSSDKAKCWPPANFAKLMDELAERYPFKIILIGSPETVTTAAEILQLTRLKDQFLDLTGKTSLAQTVSLLRHARLLISNDSGPVHVAAGVGAWVISLFLRNDPGINALRWKPLGKKGFILPKNLSASGDCKPILPQQVLELTDQILGKDSQYEIF